MRKVCIYGAGAALAEPVIRRFQKDSETLIVRVFRTGPYNDVAEADVIITLTGKVRNGLIGELQQDDWRDSIEDNLVSVCKFLSRALPRMANGGNVVVVGSIVGSTGGYGCANYAAAKAGLVGLVRAAANEVASRKICVNMLELGYVDAGMGARLDADIRERVLKTIPLRRFATTEEVADAVEYLAKIKYMTGNVLTLAGGLR